MDGGLNELAGPTPRCSEIYYHLYSVKKQPRKEKENQVLKKHRYLLKKEYKLERREKVNNICINKNTSWEESLELLKCNCHLAEE